MTEDDWLSCADPSVMLAYLLGSRTVTDRKARLFACACCRSIWHLLDGPETRRAVEAAEQYADELAGPQRLESARASAECSLRAAEPSNWVSVNGAVVMRRRTRLRWNAAQAAAAAAEERVTPEWLAAAQRCAANAAEAQHGLWSKLTGRPACDERRRQAALVRCVFGPARPAVVASCWLTSTVRSLARGIYDDRAWDRLPILADALQDAGCEDAAVLGHCRGEGPHTRGCWVVDLVLGKN